MIIQFLTATYLEYKACSTVLILCSGGEGRVRKICRPFRKTVSYSTPTCMYRYVNNTACMIVSDKKYTGGLFLFEYVSIIELDRTVCLRWKQLCFLFCILPMTYYFGVGVGPYNVPFYKCCPFKIVLWKIYLNLQPMHWYCTMQCFGSALVSMRIRIHYFWSMRIQIKGFDDQKLENQLQNLINTFYIKKRQFTYP